MDNPIESTAKWFHAANQQPAEPEPSVRQVAFYIGMQMEELGEKVGAVQAHMGAILKGYGNNFKMGAMDSQVAAAMADPEKVKEMLDGDLDLLWVSIGAGRALGCDVPGGYAAVTEANWAKKWDDGEFHNDPTTSKVLKPEGWTPPDLTPFVHPSLRGE